MALSGFLVVDTLLPWEVALHAGGGGRSGGDFAQPVSSASFSEVRNKGLHQLSFSGFQLVESKQEGKKNKEQRVSMQCNTMQEKQQNKL